jgi:hypothetical protein
MRTVNRRAMYVCVCGCVFGYVRSCHWTFHEPVAMRQGLLPLAGAMDRCSCPRWNWCCGDKHCLPGTAEANQSAREQYAQDADLM